MPIANDARERGDSGEDPQRQGQYVDRTVRALGLDAERLHLERRRVAPELAGSRDDPRDVGDSRSCLHPDSVGVETDAPLVFRC